MEALSAYSYFSTQLAKAVAGTETFLPAGVAGARVRAAVFTHVYTAGSGAIGAKVAIAALPKGAQPLALHLRHSAGGGTATIQVIMDGGTTLLTDSDYSMAAPTTDDVGPLFHLTGSSPATGDDSGFSVVSIETVSTVATGAVISGYLLYTENS